MPFDYGELRTKAKAIVQIPEHYRLAMEDNTRDEQERSFIWEDPGNDDCQIEITVDIETGQLISLDVHIDAKDSVDQASSAEEVRAVTDAFLAKHTSDYDAFAWVNSEEKGNLRFISYREEVGGLPLPDTGCRMTLDSGLNVICYRLEKSGRKAAPKPEWPSIIVDVETVKQQVLKTMRMELKIVELYPSMYEMEGTEPEYRLAYEPIPGHRFIDAITGMDLFGMKHYVMPSCLPITHMEFDKSKQPTIKDIGTWEIELGIDPELYLLENSKDDGESIKRLYKFRAEVVEDPESEALSVDAYMKQKWGDSLRNLEASCMIQVEKSTGCLLGFHRSKRKEEAAPSLTRKQCWEKAEQFLQQVFPDYTSYLQIEVNQEDMDVQPREREFFYLPVYFGDIPVNHERVMVSVNTSTGKICHYRGVSYEMIRDLEERNFLYPTLTAEKAFGLYCEYVRFRLRWFIDLEDEDLPVYRLIYEPIVTRQNGFFLDAGCNPRLRYIDACNGELIWERR